jgi:nucleotide-binding universal stress UspA family protein
VLLRQGRGTVGNSHRNLGVSASAVCNAEVHRMTTTILVPLDGSQLAERALSLASRLAQSAHARLVLLRVVPGDVSSIEEASRYLEFRAAGLRAHGLTVETSTRPGLEVAVEILHAIDLWAPESLVMSTHGRSAPGRWLYGSVADEVLRRAQLPVVLLPTAARAELGAERPVRILAPLDGSKLGEAALGPAYEWASRLSGEVILLQVVQWPPLGLSDGSELIELDPADQVDFARQYLNEVAARWRSGAPMRCRAVVGRPVSRMILQVAREEQVDLIAMATHGRSGIARLVLGSVAAGTIQHAETPVLVVRSPALVAAASAA